MVFVGTDVAFDDFPLVLVHRVFMENIEIILVVHFGGRQNLEHFQYVDSPSKRI